MVNNAAEAQSVIAAAKFPPQGMRGQGSPFACFELGLKTPPAYVKAANDNVIIMVQIESVEGLKNVDEICQVEGVGACCQAVI
jgi:4-hydroxy-2-oxoheptanedioate aldolase